MLEAKKKILHVFRSPIGGLFRHVTDLAREQAKRGHDVGIFCDSSTFNARTDAIFDSVSQYLSLGVTRVPMQRKPDFRDLAALRALGKVQSRIQADVLHGHGSKGGAYVRALSDAARGRSVRAYTPHGGSFHFNSGNIQQHVYSGIERLLARRTEVFLFESEYVAQCFETSVGRPNRPAFVVHNGLHSAEFDPIEYENERYDLLYIGEMLFAKGVDTLIEATAFLREKRDRHVSVLAVGSGPDKERLLDLAKKLGVIDQISFEAPQPIRQALARSKIMVMPSRAESLPYVLLEAGAAGHPLISTNVGGIPEILKPVEGRLLKAGDSMALAETIIARLDESKERQRAEADSIICYLQAEFSVDRMTDSVMQGYAAGMM
jgi:glycosyltransferase involved in cell wall biosynthesis